ncbi:MAG TPA: hypothetical protein VGL22_17315 [Terracidiphilus sp.]
MTNKSYEFFSSEESMAPTSTSQRLATLEQDKKWHWTALTVAALAVGGWCGWLTTQFMWVNKDMSSIKEDIGKIKQKVADGGLGTIVSSLEHPASPQQLAANLSLVTSQIKVDRAEGKAPDPQKIVRLSSAVKEVAVANPDVTEAWQAAAQLITYRSQTSHLDEKNPMNYCVNQPYKIEMKPDIPAAVRSNYTAAYAADLSNCIFVLHDQAGFERSQAAQQYGEMQRRLHAAGGNPPYLIFLLRNVRVIYRGGQPVTAAAFEFENCLFEFQEPASVPPPRGRKVLSDLLVADLQRVAVPLV